MARKYEYITAIEINKGLIKLIDVDGEIRVYRQRKIQNNSPYIIQLSIQRGELHPSWSKVKELPYNYVISFEDEEIMGKAKPTWKPSNEVEMIVMQQMRNK